MFDFPAPPALDSAHEREKVDCFSFCGLFWLTRCTLVPPRLLDLFLLHSGVPITHRETYIYTHKHTHTYTHAQTHAHRCRHAQTHIRVYTHPHTDTHAQLCLWVLALSLHAGCCGSGMCRGLCKVLIPLVQPWRRVSRSCGSPAPLALVETLGVSASDKSQPW